MLLSQLVLLNFILWLTLPDLQCTTSRVRCTGYATSVLRYVMVALHYSIKFEIFSAPGIIAHGLYQAAASQPRVFVGSPLIGNKKVSI